MGLITLGLSDGSLIVLNPKRIIEYHLEGEEAKEDCLLSSFELYENQQFFCMEYNMFKKSLLATGGS